MASIEEKVEEHFKALLDDLEIRHFVRVVRLERTVSWSQTRRDTNFAIPGYSASAAKQDPTGHSRDD